jgi:hypothetical protein
MKFFGAVASGEIVEHVDGIDVEANILGDLFPGDE